MFKIAKEIPGYPVKRAVWEAWRHGRRAAWLGGLDWEGLLAQPLDVIRPHLAIRTPAIYQGILNRLAAARAAAAETAPLLAAAE